MNLEKLFKMQKELDERILDRFPELRNEYLLDKKILALQVELGELAQNWRGFKFWSENQEPKPPVHNWDVSEDGLTQEWLPEWGYESYPLLEEYVDCLHFILSIGLELGYAHESERAEKWQNGSDNITDQFNFVFWCVAELKNRQKISEWDYYYAFGGFLSLGEMLGFTEIQIEQAYYDKNKINHERQEQGY